MGKSSSAWRLAVSSGSQAWGRSETASPKPSAQSVAIRAPSGARHVADDLVVAAHDAAEHGLGRVERMAAADQRTEVEPARLEAANERPAGLDTVSSVNWS